MTILNSEIRAKVEVIGMTSTYFAIPVDTAYIIGESVIGQNSQGSGVVVNNVTIDSQLHILITDRIGFFDILEPINGSLGTTGNTAGESTFQTVAYEKPEFGVTAGVWELYSDGDHAIKFEDSIRRVDIKKGGTYAKGYTFGFSVLNLTLIESFITDGVFVKNLDVKYYIDFGDGNGFTQIWTGILDTYPVAGAISASFKCIDSMKKTSNKFGSEKVPIALNFNNNCKLVKVYEDFKKDSYQFIAGNVGRRFGNAVQKNNYPIIENNEIKSFSPIDESLNSIVLIGYNGSEWIDALNNLNGLTITVVAGPSAQSSFNIVNIDNVGTITGGEVFVVYLDGSNSSISIGLGSDAISLLQLSTNFNDYIISKNQVKEIFEEKTSFTESVRIYENKNKRYFSKSAGDFSVNQNGITLKGFSDDEEFLSKEDFFIRDDNLIRVVDDNFSTLYATYKINASIYDDSLLNIKLDSSSVYIDLDDITLTIPEIIGINKSAEVAVSTIKGVATYKNSETDYYFNPVIMFDGDLNASVNFIDDKMIIKPNISFEQIKFDGIYDSSVFSSVNIKFYLDIKMNYISQNDAKITDMNVNGLRYVKHKNVKISDIGAGCTGENLVGIDGFFAGYPETIKYIDTVYNNIDITDINEQSYTEAEEEYENFPGSTIRNPAPQIIEQVEFNDLLDDLLYSSHLVFFPDREGKRTLSNWLYKSAVFTDWTTDNDFSNFLRISPITKERGNDYLSSDYELHYDYSEAENRYLGLIRIKNTNLDTFNFDTCIEGVSDEFYAECFEAWTLLRRGRLRINRDSKTIVKNKVIKNMPFSGGVQSEAINFILNQAGYITREREKINHTHPLTREYCLKELMDFDSIDGGKITNFEPRNGWLTYIRVSFESKEITFEHDLDISSRDPFLYEINPIQDDPLQLVDIIEDDINETEVIEDGI